MKLKYIAHTLFLLSHSKLFPFGTVLIKMQDCLLYAFAGSLLLSRAIYLGFTVQYVVLKDGSTLYHKP